MGIVNGERKRLFLPFHHFPSYPRPAPLVSSRMRCESAPVTFFQPDSDRVNSLAPFEVKRRATPASAHLSCNLRLLIVQTFSNSSRSCHKTISRPSSRALTTSLNRSFCRPDHRFARRRLVHTSISMNTTRLDDRNHIPEPLAFAHTVSAASW